MIDPLIEVSGEPIFVWFWIWGQWAGATNSHFGTRCFNRAA